MYKREEGVIHEVVGGSFSFLFFCANDLVFIIIFLYL